MFSLPCWCFLFDTSLKVDSFINNQHYICIVFTSTSPRTLTTNKISLLVAFMSWLNGFTLKQQHFARLQGCFFSWWLLPTFEMFQPPWRCSKEGFRRHNIDAFVHVCLCVCEFVLLACWLIHRTIISSTQAPVLKRHSGNSNLIFPQIWQQLYSYSIPFKARTDQ